jgi:hypothetical protein
MNITDIVAFLLLLLIGIVSSRPAMQRIVINNHEWEVPNEPGWEEVIKAAELVQQRLTSCVTVPECRRIAEEMSAVFYNYPVSKKYLENHKDDADDILESIFKWG